MAATEEAQVPAMASETALPAEAAQPPAEKSSKPATEKKPRAPKAPKEKKPRAPKSASPSHPTYFQMIKEAISALNEKGGSSPHAISKYMEEKYKSVLPSNFRKMLTVQLRNCVAKGKLVKVKGSFKLSEAGKKVAAVKKGTVAKGRKPKAAAGAAVVAPKPKGKPDAGKKKRKAPAPAAPSKRKAAKGGMKKVKKAATAKPKQPKSIKSPAAKKARKMVAA
uniref:Histone H1 n=1 Tax=Anthurium amnicola TaxID=1678845 RepID=A0A1D1YXV8_9ARAE